MQKVLIVGANRGIGLALSQLHVDRGDHVIAACRKASADLQNLGVQLEAGVDVTIDDTLRDLSKRLDSAQLDRVIVCAGVLSRETLDALDDDAAEQIRRQFEVNALAPLRVINRLLPQLGAGAKVAILTSRMGSIADNSSGGYYGYRMSKAAVNAAGRSLALDLAPRGIAVFLLHPGFVRTDMTGGNGDTSPAQSAANIASRLDALSIQQSGSFRHANGQTLPW